MTNGKTTKRALLTSSVSILLCFAMLIGTTFAWFTDSVTSANNRIQAGTLDIDLLMDKEKNGTYVSIGGDTGDIFSADGNGVNWEPGKTEIVYLAVENKGSLALKYNILLDIKDEGLIGSLEYALLDGAKAADLRAATKWADITSGAQTGLVKAGRTKAAAGGMLEGMTNGAKDTDYFALAVHMKEEAGNEYQDKGIKIDVNIVATQKDAEEDSFGDDYDAEASLDFYPVANADALQTALANQEPNILLSQNIVVPGAYEIDYPVTINGGGNRIARTDGTALMTLAADEPVIYTGTIFTVKTGQTLTLENAIVDGGAIWTGEVNATLQRGTTNGGVTATGALVTMEGNGVVILGEGAVLQNNDGANAVAHSTRGGSKLIVNGGEIINNHSAAGAIWGGGETILNSGKINGNHGGIGGAIRVVTNVGTVLTMNGGEMNHNLSDDVGGAIWAGSSRSSNVYVLNGGEMAYNYSPKTGGAIYAGHYETVKIGGTFKLHDNASAADIGDAIRFHDHASLVMTGGEVYNNGDNSLFLNNNSASITGGKISDNFGYGGGLGLTIGKADIEGVITYNLSTNHNTAYLAAQFNAFAFKVNESAANFSQFNFQPANGYTYTEGDEAKLICKNAGYETYWDAGTGRFRLRAK